MNPQIKQLFAEYLLDAKNPVAAAVLTLADTLYQEPIIIESDDKETVGVKEAELTSYKQREGLLDVPRRQAAVRADRRARSASPSTRSAIRDLPVNAAVERLSRSVNDIMPHCGGLSRAAETG